jgi:hypothetical protein
LGSAVDIALYLASNEGDKEQIKQSRAKLLQLCKDRIAAIESLLASSSNEESESRMQIEMEEAAAYEHYISSLDLLDMKDSDEWKRANERQIQIELGLLEATLGDDDGAGSAVIDELTELCERAKSLPCVHLEAHIADKIAAYYAAHAQPDLAGQWYEREAKIERARGQPTKALFAEADAAAALVGTDSDKVAGAVAALQRKAADDKVALYYIATSQARACMRCDLGDKAIEWCGIARAIELPEDLRQPPAPETINNGVNKALQYDPPLWLLVDYFGVYDVHCEVLLDKKQYKQAIKLLDEALVAAKGYHRQTYELHHDRHDCLVKQC